MNTRLSQSSLKTMLVLFNCFCLGVLVTSLVMYLLPVLTDQKQQKQTKSLIQKQEQEQEQKQSNTVNHKVVKNMTKQGPVKLVTITLPEPPTNRAKTKSVKKQFTSHSANVKAVQTPQVNTNQAAVLAQGLALLKNTQRDDAPQIKIELPKDERQRNAVIHTLRVCLGVTLGKISAQGKIISREVSSTSFSPYLRLVEGKLTNHEQKIAKQWRKFPGSIVRFYPEEADARILGGLHQLVQGSIEHKIITGKYSLQQGELRLVNIKINKQPQQTELLLAKSC